MNRPGFAVYCDGVVVKPDSDGLSVRSDVTKETEDGVWHSAATFLYGPGCLVLESHRLFYPAAQVTEVWICVRNEGDKPVRVDRIDSFDIKLPPDEYELMYYTSGWGAEFESVRLPLQQDFILETRTGRSSNGAHPWFTLFGRESGMFSASAMWSGNWVFRFEKGEDGRYALSGGLHDWEFHKVLQPGESMEGIHVAMVTASGSDLNDISVQYARAGRKHWYPANALSEGMPAEWNHWWSYEDRKVDESVILENASAASGMGLDVVTLDAGWFGPAEEGTGWYDYRGDWDLVNDRRFPRGIRGVSDEVHRLGLKFGLWCEIEAVGKFSRLASNHPEFLALRNGEALGYVCFGNERVQEWAFDTLDRLITEYGCNWIKLDFNLDPCAGCNRSDHGHGTGDGLFEHYRGYYRTLQRIGDKHPDVLLESCSSGGLRIDLGLLRHTHTTFLSDPDWPEHSLQVFWGASTMLAPNVCLHWSFSEWLGQHPFQSFDPHHPGLTPYQLDYYTRISMLGGYGLSQKLPGLPDWIKSRLAEHTATYKRKVAHFIRTADLFRLTGQPKREGRGDRWAAFQYSLPDRSEHLLFVFRLRGAQARRCLPLKELQEDRVYTLTWLDEGTQLQVPGAELLSNGLILNRLREEESCLVHIR